MNQVSFNHSLGTKLLRYVFSLYFMITLVVTLVQMYLEYERTKNQIFDEIRQIETVFQGGLSESLWHYGNDQAISIIEGLLKSNLVKGVRIENVQGKVFVENGPFNIQALNQAHKEAIGHQNGFSKIALNHTDQKKNRNYYEYSFPLTYSEDGSEKKIIGHCFVYTTQSLVLERVSYGFILIFINSVIKTLALWLIFLLMTRLLVTKPLATFSKSVQKIDPEAPVDDGAIKILAVRRDEIGVLSASFLKMIDAVKANIQIIQGLNANLEAKVNQRTMELARTNAEISKLLESLRQGILVFKDNFLIGDKYSMFLEQILEEKHLCNKNVFDLVFHKTNLSGDQKSQIQNVVEMCMGAPEVMFLPNQHLLPTEVEWIGKDGVIKYLAFDWETIVDRNQGHIEQIMLVIRDVTQVKALQEEAKSRKLELNVLIQIVKGSVVSFLQFMEDAHEKLSQVNSLLLDKPIPFAQILKVIHTLKGNSRMRDYSDITEAIHIAERKLAELEQKALKMSSRSEAFYQEIGEEAAKVVNGVSSTCLVFEEIYKKNLGDYSEATQLQKLRQSLQFLRERLKMLLQIPKLEQVAMINEMEEVLEAAEAMSLRQIIHECQKPLRSIAAELEKTAPHVEIQSTFDDEAMVFKVRENAQRLKDGLVHVIRNSLDHGIENDKMRYELGKKVPGTLTFFLDANPNHVSLHISDDGAGLDLKKIKEKAHQLGIEPADESDQSIAELIFHSSFSTREEVTQVSGCGIGMAALRHYIEEMGGKVHLRLGGLSGVGNQVAMSLVIEINLEVLTKVRIKGDVVAA